MMKRPHLNWLTPVLATAIALSLGACSSDDKDKDKEADGPSKSASAEESVDPANVSPANLPKVPKVKKAKGAINDLKLDKCAFEEGKQSVTGEITSSAKDPVDYLVTVSWTTASSDVMGKGFVVIKDIKPGGTESFKVEAKVKDGATQCVPGVTYGVIG